MLKPESIRVYLKNPGKAVLSLAEKGFMNRMGDRAFLKLLFRTYTGYPLNLDHPQTFNEKLQWLKLNDRREEYRLYVDKYEVKRYIAETIGDEHVIPTLGVWDAADRIDFDKLPDQFVLKCVHGSGCNIMCKDKKTLNIHEVRGKLDKWMRRNWFWLGREWPYKEIKPRIIAEPYLDDGTGQLKDYKFFCFDGIVKCFKVDFDRDTIHKANYFTPAGDLLEFGEEICPPDFNRKIALPSSLADMIQIAEKLSKGIPFVRVDLYDVKGQILFGELTLYPAAGIGTFTDRKWDYTLGAWIKLPGKDE